LPRRLLGYPEQCEREVTLGDEQHVVAEDEAVAQHRKQNHDCDGHSCQKEAVLAWPAPEPIYDAGTFS
jgi:hypothetical protein